MENYAHLGYATRISALAVIMTVVGIGLMLLGPDMRTKDIGTLLALPVCLCFCLLISWLFWQ